jgi:molybdate transport system substrate-binding protein
MNFNLCSVLLAMSCLVACKSKLEANAPIRVAAAADLTAAFEELGKAFEHQSGQKVIFTFGSSGQLTKQVQEGAPFDVLAAANGSFVDQAVKAGACDGSTRALYGRGRIAIWSRKGFAAPPAKLEDLADARFVKVAIANPEHAPYGVAAREALKAAGVWDAVEARLVFGENVRQAMQLAETGNVEAAIVALSLVVQDKTNPSLLIDDALHSPIEQALVVCTRGSNLGGGKAFADWVNAPEGREVMRRYGFGLPGEVGRTP